MIAEFGNGINGILPFRKEKINKKNKNVNSASTVLPNSREFA
jgi:hypothetical protein